MNIFSYLLSFTVFLILSGCSSVQNVVYENRGMTSEQKIRILNQYFAKKSQYSVRRDINKRSDNKICSSGLDCAIYTRDIKVAEYLLRKGANPNLRPKGYLSNYIIQNAIIRSRNNREASDFVDLLLKYKARPDSCRYLKTTAINLAIKKHYHGAAFRLMGIGGATKKSSLCDEYFLQSGRGVNFSPLVQSIISARDGNKNDFAIVISMLKAGSDPFNMGFPQSQKNFHYTPMSYAKERNKPKLAQSLYEYYNTVKWVKSSDKTTFFRRAASRDKGMGDYKKEVARKKRSRDAWLLKELARKAEAKRDRKNSVNLPKNFIYTAANNYKKSYISKRSYSAKKRNNLRNNYKKSVPARDTTCRDAKHCNAKMDGLRTDLKKKHIHKFKSIKSNEHACANTRLYMSGYQDVCSSFGGKKGAKSQHVSYPVGVNYERCQCSSFGNCSTSMTIYCKY